MKFGVIKGAALGVAFALTLAGCGSNLEGEAAGTLPSTQAALASAQTEGISTCLKCHGSNTYETNSWANSAHGNQAPVSFPDYAYASSDASCVNCHDKLGDGVNLSKIDITLGDAPVIGCESCHGGGQYHKGIGPIPYPAPGPEQCGQCHNADFTHNAYHPEADNIVEDYLASPHARSINSHNYADNGSDVRARCSKCHTDEGFDKYRDVTGNYNTLSTELPLTLPALSNVSVVSCRTCHDVHGSELVGAGYNSVDTSAEYATCTSCHQDGSEGAAYHDPEKNQYGALGEIITDTHFGATGYNIDPSDERACRNCHNVHAADTTINNQWAQSGHGDKTAVPFTSAYGMQLNPACQECHSETAAKLLFEAYENQTAYSAPGANVREFSGVEVITCTVCHTDNVGGLRNPGEITTHYHAAGTDAYATLDAGNGSNLCLHCHAGKRSGEDTKDNPDLSVRITSHYTPVGGIFYNTIGYQFDHLDAGLTYGATWHARLGNADDALADYPYKTLTTEQVTAIQGTGNGPCVACHMAEGTDKHLYSVFTDNTELGLPDLCYNCHANNPAAGHYFKSQEKLEGEIKVAYQAVLSHVAGMMADGTKNFTGAVLTQAATGQFQKDGVNLDPAADLDLAGALFNYKLFMDEPGAYVHNRYYTKQLLFDTIDYLEDGSIDGTLSSLTYASNHAAAEWLDKDNTEATGLERR